MGQLSEPLIIQQLSLAERILIVEEIWDSIVAEQASLPVTNAQQAELDNKRLRLSQNWRRLKSAHLCSQVPLPGATAASPKAA